MEVVNYILLGLVEAVNLLIIFVVNIKGKDYEIIFKLVGLIFLIDIGVFYVEVIFFWGILFLGIVLYNV